MTAIKHEPQFLQNTPLKTMLAPERAPHKTPCQEQPHISASQLRSYASCPLAWRLSRTQRPEHTSAALVFGSAFHAAAECFYQFRLEGKDAAFQDLMDAYDEKWQEHLTPKDGKEPIPIRHTAKSDPASLRQTAVRMLEAFIVHAKSNMGEVIAVEESFEVNLAVDLPILKGRIDLIEIRTDESGCRALHIADFKTAAKRMSEDEVDGDQMNLYALAARQTGLLEQLGLPLVLRVDAITKTKISEVIPLTLPPSPSNEARVIAKAREIWKGMSSGICYPTTSWRCADCGYRSACAKWPDIFVACK